MIADIEYQSLGSVVVVQGLTDDAKEWLFAFLDPDAMRWAGSYVIEPRYVPVIIAEALADGLTVAESA